MMGIQSAGRPDRDTYREFSSGNRISRKNVSSSSGKWSYVRLRTDCRDKTRSLFYFKAAHSKAL